MADETGQKRRSTDDWRLRALVQAGALAILGGFGWLYFESDKIQSEQAHQQMLSLIQQCTGYSE